MKRFVLLTMGLVMFLLVGCNPFAAPQTELEKALSHIQEAHNYRVEIMIDMDFIVQEIDMQFTETLVYYAFGDSVVYYERDGLRCYAYEPVDNQLERAEIVCDSEGTSAYAFYRSFSPSWFSQDGGRYRLQAAHHDAFVAFFATTFPDAQAESVMLTLKDDKIDTLTFDLSVEGDVYSFTMTFSAFGTVQLSLPAFE